MIHPAAISGTMDCLREIGRLLPEMTAARNLAMARDEVPNPRVLAEYDRVRGVVDSHLALGAMPDATGRVLDQVREAIGVFRRYAVADTAALAVAERYGTIRVSA